MAHLVCVYVLSVKTAGICQPSSMHCIPVMKMNAMLPRSSLTLYIEYCRPTVSDMCRNE